MALPDGIPLGAMPVPQDTDKRPLEHEDYDRWNAIVGTSVSRDGKWLVYTLRDGKDKATLKIRSLDSTKEYTVSHGTGARISYDSRQVAYRVVPDPELIKKLKKEEKPEAELPKAKFEILDLNSGQTFTMEGVKSFTMPRKNGDWIAIHLESPKEDAGAKETKAEASEKFEITVEGLKRPDKKAKKKAKEKNKGKKAKEKKKAEAKAESKEQQEKTKQGKASEEKQNKETSAATKKEQEAEKKILEKKKKKKKDGTVLVVRNLSTGVEQRIPQVASFRFDESGTTLAFVTSSKEKGEQDSVGVLDLSNGKRETILKGMGNYKNLVFNMEGSKLAFVTDRDDYKSKDSSWSLYLWKSGQAESKKILSAGTEGLPENWLASSAAAPFFAESGKYLYCYSAPKPADADEDEDAEPQAKLDIWHWQDPLLQPQQLLQAEQEKDRSYLMAYNLRSRKLHQLADIEVPDVFADAERNSDILVGISTEKYQKTISWDMPGYRDVYLINARTGKRKLALERLRSQPQMSPDGKFIVWWDTESRNWFSMSTGSDDSKNNLTESIKHPLFDELHDTPSDPPPHGIAGWTEDDRRMLVYDRYDIWELDPSGDKPPVCATNSVGRDSEIRFRFRQLDREARSIDPTKPMVLTAFNEDNKESGFYWLHLSKSKPEADDDSNLEPIVMLPEQVAGLQKAQDSDRVIFTRSTFRRFPDIWKSNLEFETVERMSEANPHQDEYSWGTVELTSWTATDGQEIDGMIYKPDGFDPEKKYPLMVYFYERNSDNLHRHWAPAAGRSIINFSFYVSRGYVVFVPDIPYTTGEPGPSAVNAVLPGVKHVVDMGFIDEKRIGTQGHSWGGYQTAYLVTQTDMFACAESGAPVSNMTSAYGGIRWSSGLSRMFQYERTQSRIGDTLWNARDKYIANSPLFFVDKINTPLLILHNDEDGAVPWYQGIEMFVAMRRLEKPAWLLNYNGNPHWVMGRENRLDFAKRMQQFFDHYLKDEPMPDWMASGIPAVDKGKEFGFEFTEAESESEESETAEEQQAEEAAADDRPRRVN